MKSTFCILFIYFLFIYFFNFCLYSRSEKAELAQPFSNDFFQRTVYPMLVYKQNPPYQQRVMHLYFRRRREVEGDFGFYVYFSS